MNSLSQQPAYHSRHISKNVTDLLTRFILFKLVLSDVTQPFNQSNGLNMPCFTTQCQETHAYWNCCNLTGQPQVVASVQVTNLFFLLLNQMASGKCWVALDGYKMSATWAGFVAITLGCFLWHCGQLLCIPTLSVKEMLKLKMMTMKMTPWTMGWDEMDVDVGFAFNIIKLKLKIFYVFLLYRVSNILSTRM